jgi:hypothetical protein
MPENNISENINFLKNHKNIKNRINLKKVNIFLCSMFVFCLSYYLISINDLSIKGFYLKDFQNQESEFLEEKESVEEEISMLKSLDNLKERAGKINLVSVGDVKYINNNDLMLAKK